ncbi:hypothetical protein E2C01_006001 [Portunus trituberculatus]|uniref:Uncharacterized protein n=1 Tax=Portunus trituberculatus TaxID=210409 RepID=A0A5B7D0L8_PORTR|nr:hypothetical protein [Portunus trituberculatus]
MGLQPFLVDSQTLKVASSWATVVITKQESGRLSSYQTRIHSGHGLGHGRPKADIRTRMFADTSMSGSPQYVIWGSRAATVAAVLLPRPACHSQAQQTHTPPPATYLTS